jgi:2'-5' RNA ligase
MTRTFIALEMHEEQQRHLAEVIGRVAKHLPGVHWVNAASIHLTLAFLGELDDIRLAEAIRVTEVAAQQARSFSYRLSRIGVFGSVHRPRVIWMGIDESSGALLYLHRILNRELERSGFEVDRRPFSPHLTLARVKNPLLPAEMQQLQHILMGKQQDIVSAQEYPTRQVYVMKSELLKTGAHYTCLQACLLRA